MIFMMNQHLQRVISSVRIIPFIGYGNRKQVLISGIVVAENGVSKPSESQSVWQNMKSMIRRYMSNEIEYAEVRVRFMGLQQTVITDKYGIYRCVFESPTGSSFDGLWQKVYISLPPLDSETEGEVMVIPHEPEFVVISDIDDTILVSYATQKIQKLMLMLLNNAHTRMPFEGVSAFYQALQKGKNGGAFNPVFYVSNSEWNLFDLLYEFILFNRIPKGPLILREMAIYLWRPWKMREVNKFHKKEAIRRIFTVYESASFILIGDSGQKDARIYSEIVSEFPGRVLAIYIRDLGIKQNLVKIDFIRKSLHEQFSTEMILVKDSETAARHAIEKGYISAGYLDMIRHEKEKDHK
jgi:phosphatidate phosphatase APP1